MSSYTSSKGNSSFCPCPTRSRVEDATLDDIAAVVAGLNDKVLLLRKDILGLKYLDTTIHSGSASPIGYDAREIRPSLEKRTLTQTSHKRGKRIQEAGDSIHSDESSLKSFNGEYTKSKARNLTKPKRSSVFKFGKSQGSKYEKDKRREKLSEYSGNYEIFEQPTFFPASKIEVIESPKVQFSGKHKKVKKKPSRIKEFIRKGRVSQSKFQMDEVTRNRGNGATLILNDFQEREKLTGGQSLRSPDVLHKCQSIQKSLNLANSVYCDCEMAPPVFRKIVRKRISRGVQYEDPKISKPNERACLNCFKPCKCSKKHRKKMANSSKSKKPGTPVDKDSVEVVFRPEDQIVNLSKRENSKKINPSSDQNDVRNGRQKLNSTEIYGFDTHHLNIPLHESLKGIKHTEGIYYSSKEIPKQSKKMSDRETRGKYKEKNAERQFTRYSKDSHALNEMQLEKLKHVRKNDQKLKNNDQFISNGDTAKTIDVLNNGDYTPNIISLNEPMNKRAQRMSGGGEEEYELAKCFKTQKRSVFGIDNTKNQSNNLSDWSMTKTIFKKITGGLFSNQISLSKDQIEETRTSRNNTIDETLHGLRCNRQINVNNIKKRLDSCLVDLNNIMLDVSFICKENRTARRFADEPK
ncbi:uncharacterized protein LOC107271590 [Cephus cinctus]|uniref:Uncharacterized protein LOC107271590 n=1 Tax=Cephus cinctus TaxID=211228 RepID=A0AAJ7C6M9_CEPCN|nr:uncharacterized protein LOC107271590 [Cephus cinctus]